MGIKTILTLIWIVVLIFAAIYFISIQEWIGLINYIILWLALIMQIWTE